MTLPYHPLSRQSEVLAWAASQPQSIDIRLPADAYTADFSGGEGDGKAYRYPTC
jgi:hypothetical protein